jgi:HK97 gp10 family phage protein
MTVRGGKETARNFRALASFVSVPLNATSRFALQPTLAAAKSNVRSIPFREGTGTLAASLTIKRAKSSKINPVHQVGPDASKSASTRYGKRRPVRYAHLLEFGTVSGVSPTPFLTPAYFSTRDEVVKRFGERYGPEIEKRAAKLGATVRT